MVSIIELVVILGYERVGRSTRKLNIASETANEVIFPVSGIKEEGTGNAINNVLGDPKRERSKVS